MKEPADTTMAVECADWALGICETLGSPPAMKASRAPLSL
jgi:hypothetical protein